MQEIGIDEQAKCAGGETAPSAPPAVNLPCHSRLAYGPLDYLPQGTLPMCCVRRAHTDAAKEEGHRAVALPDPQLTFGLRDLRVTGTDAFDPNVDSFATMLGKHNPIGRSERHAQLFPRSLHPTSQ
jgi:hypothetical protein